MMMIMTIVELADYEHHDFKTLPSSFSNVDFPFFLPNMHFMLHTSTLKAGERGQLILAVINGV